MSPEVATILVSVVIIGVLINLVLLGFMLKLYTEIFKERAFSKRAEKEPGPLVRELMRPEGPRGLSPEIITARKVKATEWQIHGGNVRQHGRFMASRPDQETMHKAADALDEAANFILSTTIASHPSA